MASRLTEAERDRVLELHRERMTCTDIARTVGRSTATVSRLVAAAGLTFERAAQTAPATRAVQRDNRDRRAYLESRLLTEAEHALDRLHQPVLVHSFGGRDNTYAEHVIPGPGPSDTHALMRAAGVAIDKAARLAETDRATNDAEAGRSIVADLFAALNGTVNAA